MRPILAAAVALVGCATVRPEPQQYVDTFRAEAQARGVRLEGSVEVVLVSSLGGPAGRCYADSGRVLIARDFWENSDWSDDTRREAVYHELGHCWLRLPHQEGPDSFFGHPASLMHPELLGGPWYAANEPTYLDRLFKKETR